MNATRRRPKRVALYLRVSTSEQTTRNQRRELKAVADRHGWEVVKVWPLTASRQRERLADFDFIAKSTTLV